MFTITIETDNAAFQDDPGAELARILEELSDLIQFSALTTNRAGHKVGASLRDINGNKVGAWEWSGGQA